MKWLTNVMGAVAKIKHQRNMTPATIGDDKFIKIDNDDANAIHMIHPYKSDGVWMFDDKRKNISREPFVSGADEILDFISEYEQKCVLLFSGDRFPGCTFRLNKTYDEGKGAWYSLCQLAQNKNCKDITNIKHGWLCAVVTYYFNGSVPKEIYVQVK